MKIPVLHNIDLASFHKNNIMKALMDAHTSENPVSIQISAGVSNSKALEILDMLDEILIDLKINPILPYPIFIIYPHKISHSKVVIFKTSKELTEYYVLKIKKLKKRESHLLTKVKMLTTRINNYRLNNNIEIIKSKSIVHRKLKNACMERAFYSTILEDIRKNENN